MKYSDLLSDSVKQKAWRTAVAFGMDSVNAVSFNAFCGYSRDIRVSFGITSEGRLAWVNCSQSAHSCYVGGQATTPSSRPELNAFAVKGLFCSGYDEKEALSILACPLSRHEQLELRARMPRHLWPSSWQVGPRRGGQHDFDCEDVDVLRTGYAFEATRLRFGKYPDTFEGKSDGRDVEFRLKLDGSLMWVQLSGVAREDVRVKGLSSPAPLGMLHFSIFSCLDKCGERDYWRVIAAQDLSLNSAMMRGLFRLGMDALPETGAFGAPLSSHEKLAFRDAMPLKFHPPHWGPRIGDFDSRFPLSEDHVLREHI